MKSKKTVRKALWMSVLSIALCLTMLVGTTFAWFTDTASTAVNKIQSGTLKVDIVDKNGTSIKGGTMNFVNANGSNDILWEPGVTFKTTGFKVKNIGNLALKFKLAINGATGNSELLQVITFSVVNKEGTEIKLDSFEGHLNKKDDVSDELYIQGHMVETAGNNYQGKFLEGVGITVYATQDTVENDSFGNTYDANAQYPVYPAGITKDSFTNEQKAVDANGTFYPSFKDAMEQIADGGTLYFKEDSVVDFPTHLNVTKNITIQGNGADFSGKDISIGTYEAPESAATAINIYNTKNLVVWGQPTANLSDNVTWNVNFENCENDGYNFLMYRGGATATAKINLTLTNCKANGFGDSIVHTTADGSIVIKNCTFTNNCAPVNIAHKQSGALTVTVENSTFVNCGKIDTANDYFAPARFVNNSATGTLTVNLTNNTFTGTIGTNGDILLGDYRTGKPSHVLTANITTVSPVMVKSSIGAAYSCNGGTTTLN